LVSDRVRQTLLGILYCYNPEGKSQPRRPRFRWEENIRMNPREINWGASGSGWVLLEGSCEHGSCINDGIFLDQMSDC